MTDDALPSLIWNEARERKAVIDVERCDILVDLTELSDGDEFHAVSTVRFGYGERGAATFVDCGADIMRATLDSTDITSDAAGARIPLRAWLPTMCLWWEVSSGTLALPSAYIASWMGALTVNECGALRSG